MTWFPSNNHPLDKATFTMRLTVPKPYQAAANGVLSDTQDNGSSTTYVWQMTDPMATYLATVHIGRYEVITAAGPDGVVRRDYFPLGTPASVTVSYTHLRAHETVLDLVCRLLLEKKQHNATDTTKVLKLDRTRDMLHS